MGAVEGSESTALHDAAYQGHAAVCDILLRSEKFTAANATDDNCDSALHHAARNGYPSVCSILRASPKFDLIAARNCSKLTALDLATSDVVRQSLVSAIS